MSDLGDYESDDDGLSHEERLQQQLLINAGHAAERAVANDREVKRLENHELQANYSGDWTLTHVYKKYAVYREEFNVPEVLPGEAEDEARGRKYIYEWPEDQILDRFQLEPFPEAWQEKRLENEFEFRRRRLRKSHDFKKDVRPPDNSASEFLNGPPAALPGNIASWKGIKFLGQGSFGRVGLFERDDPVPQNGHKRIVVKESLVRNGIPGDLSPEDHIMDLLNTSTSDHWVKHIIQSDRVVAGQYPNGTSIEYVRRVYLEYCSLDLDTLLMHRRSQGRPLWEASIWRLLDCMIDGLALLEMGREFDLDEEVVKETPAVRDWKQIVHFDIKPPNLLLHQIDPEPGVPITHPYTPIVKIADFGTAVEYTEVDLPDKRHTRRLYGTPGYHLPEQWTKRWDYEGWEQSGIAGQYSTKSNIWQMGIILYHLITCHSRFPPIITKPFKPTMPMFGEESKGITFGWDLHEHIERPEDYNPEDSEDELVQRNDIYRYRHSRALIHTCWEMLYEIPAHRPSLKVLKERVLGILKHFTEEYYEPLDSFQVPEREEPPAGSPGGLLSYSPPPRWPAVNDGQNDNNNDDDDDDDDGDDDGDNEDDDDDPNQNQDGERARVAADERRQPGQAVPASNRSRASQATSGLSSAPSIINTPPGFRSPASSILSDPPTNLSIPSTFRSVQSVVSSILSEVPSYLSVPSTFRSIASTQLSAPPSVIETPEAFRNVGQRGASEAESSSSESSSELSSSSEEESSSSSESDHSDYNPRGGGRGAPSKGRPPRGPRSGNANVQNQRTGPSRGTRSQTRNQPGGFVSMAMGVVARAWSSISNTNQQSGSRAGTKRKRGGGDFSARGGKVVKTRAGQSKR